MDSNPTQDFVVPNPVIVMGNQKGGVGKTTNSINVAAALGSLGYRVLLIDADAEANSTQGLGVSADKHAGIYEVCLGHFPIERVALTEGMPENVHLVPSRTDVTHLHRKMDLSTDEAIFNLLRPHTDRARQLYDVVLIDSPPGAGTYQAVAALAVADFMIFSVKDDSYSFDAMLKAMREMIMPIKEGANPDLEILGVLVSDVLLQSHDWIRDLYAPMFKQNAHHFMFQRRIRKHGFIKKCQRLGCTVFQHPQRGWEKNRGIVEDYQAVAGEIVRRMTDYDDYVDMKMVDESPAFKKTLEKHLAEIEKGESAAEAAEGEETPQGDPVNGKTGESDNDEPEAVDVVVTAGLDDIPTSDSQRSGAVTHA